MNRFKIVLIVTILVVGLLSGCATGGGPVYVKPGADQATMQKDLNECRFLAAQATASGPAGSLVSYNNNSVTNALAEGMRRGELLRACLINRGYSRQYQ